MTTKVKIFRSAFKGRQDIVPRHWISRDGKKQGYTPLCKNEWKDGICHKPCRTCSNADYIPLSGSLILDHFRGKYILGIYPLLKDNTCHFITVDFDDHNNDQNPLEDVKAFVEACQIQDVPCYVLRSKGGKGYHAYIFFKTPVPAWKARIVVFALLQEASIISNDVKLSSFDRLFPNQDELSGKGFGNLIALPFQGNAAQKGRTLILDLNTGFMEPYKDQWGVLANVKRIPEQKLNELIDEWDLKRGKSQSGKGIGCNLDNTNKAIERIMECRFVKWAKEEPAKVSEPLWYALISNLLCIRPGGYSLCHALSKGYPKYSREETDLKIHQAMDTSGAHSCEYINRNGFDCDRQCQVKAPAALIFNHKNRDPMDVKRQRIKVSFG